MAPMPVTDAMFLLAEARERPMHVGGLQIFSPPDEFEPHYVRAVYRELVEHGEVIPRLRRRPVRGVTDMGLWHWEEDDDLDLEYHLRHSALPDPGRIRELLALVSRLHGTLLDRSRPMWESHLIEGLADGRIATYTKIHHSVMDGVSQMRLLERGLSPDPDVRDLPPPMFLAPGTTPRSRRSGGGLPGPVALAKGAVGAGVEGVKGLVGASESMLRTIWRSFSDQAAALPYKAPASPLNVPISASRRFAADDWDLDRIKAAAKQQGGTVNDVVLAMCAGALRRYLIEIDGLPDDPLVAMVPVSLRGEDDDDETAGNAVGLILCNLATHLEDPIERFSLIHRSSEEGKLQLKGLNQLGILMLGGLTLAPLGAGPLQKLVPGGRPPFNLVISNVPGPKTDLYWNGAKLDGSYPTSIPVDYQALNITVTSYGSRMGFGLIACRRSLPSMQRLLEHLETSLTELEA